MVMQMRALLDLCKEAIASWSNDYAPSMGAALAYYTVFSIAPLLLIVIAVAGLPGFPGFDEISVGFGEMPALDDFL